jgi:uncharacterized protein YerC
MKTISDIIEEIESLTKKWQSENFLKNSETYNKLMIAEDELEIKMKMENSKKGK